MNQKEENPKDLPVIKEKTARAILIINQHLLAMRFPPKNICFVPGGRVEPDEDFLMALKRELGEELPGHTFVIGRELGVINHHWQDNESIRETEHHFFEVQSATLHTDMLPAIVEPPLEFIWLDRHQMKEANLTPQSLPKHVEQMFDSKDFEFWNEIDSSI